jgi:hypothetical protein
MTATRRELFAEFVTDASQLVIPEFTPEAKAKIVLRRPVPVMCHKYVAMDPGFNDRTGLLFGYHDFRAGKLVIQKALLLHKASTSDIAKAIVDTEYALWAEDRPLLRVSDVDPRLLADLYERHGLVFSPSQKQDALGAVNLVRTMVRNEEISIDPDCALLIHQLENTIWNTKATDFERTKEGHGDLIAALKYLCRSVNFRLNPFPAGFRGEGGRDGNEFRSPRRRPGATHPGLLGNTPLGKKAAAAKPTRKRLTNR